MNETQLRKRLATLGEQRVHHSEALAALEPELRAAILDALAAGIGPTELTRLTGLSRARIYQIRDGKR